jgi:hypothetical protein
MKLQSIILVSILTAKTAAFGTFATQARISAKTSSASTTSIHANKSDLEGRRRRDFLNLIPAALITATATASPFTASANDDYSMYIDEASGFEVKTPSGWQKSEQALADRRKIVFFVNGDDASSSEKDLMFIAYTPVRDDFTALSSFGSVEQVGQMTILPKGELMGEDSNGSKMLSQESKKNSYYFDYVTKSADQPKRHLRTIFTLIQGGTGGAGAVLVTITLQTKDDRYDALKGTFDEIIDSYGKIKK